MLRMVSCSTLPVLILGESGTGKEQVARAIHTNGLNSAKPFVPVDCRSLVPDLVASELFGHVKGAFAGASITKDGLLSAAGCGTVFLDEIGELPLDLQARLLRALQEKEVRPIGATHAVPISARVLAATDRDLNAMVQDGRFRKDLYFRLNVVNLRIPPLRERKGDIAILADHFLEQIQRETKSEHAFSSEAIRVMTEYDWPGNMRELENAIYRAVALTPGFVLEMADLPTQHGSGVSHREAEQTAADARAAEPEDEIVITPLADLEKSAILGAIGHLNGDKLLAARLLGIGKTTLYRKLQEYELPANWMPQPEATTSTNLTSLLRN